MDIKKVLPEIRKAGSVMSIAKALIVDDEKNIRLTLSKCLKYMDVESDEAINGEEGLEKFKNDKFDLVILDLKMQGMDGLEVLKIIREDDKETPVVIVTAHGTVDVAVDAMKLGAADFMQKPFTPKEIQNIVKEILKRKEIIPDSIDSYESYIQYARQLIIQKDFEQSMEILKKALSLEPTKAEPHNLIGSLLEILGKTEEAQKHYRAALVMEPGYIPARTGLARINKKLKAGG